MDSFIRALNEIEQTCSVRISYAEAKAEECIKVISDACEATTKRLNQVQRNCRALISQLQNPFTQENCYLRNFARASLESVQKAVGYTERNPNYIDCLTTKFFEDFEEVHNHRNSLKAFQRVLSVFYSPNQETLDFSQSTSEEVINLADVNDFTDLFVESNHLGCEGAIAISKVLPFSGIVNLKLSREEIGDKGLEALASSFPSTHVIYLNLNWNEISNLDCLEGVLQQSSITHLELGGNLIEKSGAKALARSMQNLVTLNLKSNNLCAKAALALAKALPTCRVQKLVLKNNEIGDEGAQALADYLPHSLVFKLDLSDNGIGDTGVYKLAQALQSSLVTHLSLEDNEVSNTGIFELTKALENSKLIWVNLKNNEITQTFKELPPNLTY